LVYGVNTTISNISAILWWSVLSEETGVPGKKITDLPRVIGKPVDIMLYRAHLA